MTNEELIAEIEALDQAATPGPWLVFPFSSEVEPRMMHVGPGGHSVAWIINVDSPVANATLIARYRTLAVEAARALKETMEESQRRFYAYYELKNEVEQTLGAALGYPLWKDLPEVAPDSTEADGVCVWEHTAETLADEAARQLAELGQSRDEWRVVAATVCCDHGGICLRAAQEKAQKDTAR